MLPPICCALIIANPAFGDNVLVFKFSYQIINLRLSMWHGILLHMYPEIRKKSGILRPLPVRDCPALHFAIQ